MPIILARIDDRLIHGQITVAWSRISNPDIIAVVDDGVASSEIQRSTLGLAAPIGIALLVLTISEGVKELTSKSTHGRKRIFLIVPTPEDMLRLIEGGIETRSVNVGQMGYMQGKRRISKTLSVDDKDIQAFKSLKRLGVTLEQRQLPGDKKVKLEKLIPEIG